MCETKKENEEFAALKELIRDPYTLENICEAFDGYDEFERLPEFIDEHDKLTKDIDRLINNHCRFIAEVLDYVKKTTDWMEEFERLKTEVINLKAETSDE